MFEPLTARLRSNGLEIEFTAPLAGDAAWNPAAYHVTQWAYQATQTYGGPKVRFRRAEVRSASVSADRRRVFLELPGLVAREVVHVRLSSALRAESGQSLWAGDVWYTANRVPAGRPGEVRAAPPGATAATSPFFSYTAGSRGRELFQNFCAACHSLDGTKLVGPTFRGLAGRTRRVVDPASGAVREIVADAAYLRESILEPNARLAEGYAENLMPPLGAALSEAQVDALVSFIQQLPRPE